MKAMIEHDGHKKITLEDFSNKFKYYTNTQTLNRFYEIKTELETLRDKIIKELGNLITKQI